MHLEDRGGHLQGRDLGLEICVQVKLHAAAAAPRPSVTIHTSGTVQEAHHTPKPAIAKGLRDLQHRGLLSTLCSKLSSRKRRPGRGAS